MGDIGAPRRHYDVLALSKDRDDRTLPTEATNDSNHVAADTPPRRSEDLTNQR